MSDDLTDLEGWLAGLQISLQGVPSTTSTDVLYGDDESLSRTIWRNGPLTPYAWRCNDCFAGGGDRVSVREVEMEYVQHFLLNHSEKTRYPLPNGINRGHFIVEGQDG